MTSRKPTASDHPKVHEAFGLMKVGRMDRREFIRVAALLGTSAATAYAIAGLDNPTYADAALPFAKEDSKAKQGGILKLAMQVQKLDDPATFSWVQMSNQSRHTLEYLAMTGPDNITRPMLAESWTASPDLKTWTFNLRKGVLWHTGEELTADHVAWNIQRWLDPKTASSNVGLSVFSAMVEETAEKDAKGNPIKPQEGGAVGTRGPVQLSNRDRPPIVQGTAVRQHDRHRSLRARGTQGRREVHPETHPKDKGREGLQILGWQRLPGRDPLLPLRGRKPIERVRLDHRRWSL
jgi:hypothetical protein